MVAEILEYIPPETTAVNGRPATAEIVSGAGHVAVSGNNDLATKSETSSNRGVLDVFTVDNSEDNLPHPQGIVVGNDELGKAARILGGDLSEDAPLGRLMHVADQRSPERWALRQLLCSGKPLLWRPVANGGQLEIRAMNKDMARVLNLIARGALGRRYTSTIPSMNQP